MTLGAVDLLDKNRDLVSVPQPGDNSRWEPGPWKPHFPVMFSHHSHGHTLRSHWQVRMWEQKCPGNSDGRRFLSGTSATCVFTSSGCLGDLTDFFYQKLCVFESKSSQITFCKRCLQRYKKQFWAIYMLKLSRKFYPSHATNTPPSVTLGPWEDGSYSNRAWFQALTNYH